MTFAKYWESTKGLRNIPIPDLAGSAVPPHSGAGGKRETVSAVIMTRNSEDLVEGTLRSVASWVDEIVVIDGFSTDRTPEICRRYTDKFYQNKWDGYRFCTERNLGTSKAASDWCLHIDPDERATPELRDAVLEMLGRAAPESAVEFRKKNFFLGHWMRYGGWHHFSRHLFRKGKAFYDGIIHERLVVDGKVGKIEAAVEHYPFTSVKQFTLRHNGYSTREALAMKEEGRKAVSDAEITDNLTSKPLRRFFKFYVRKKGFLDGTHGFVFSVLFAWVHFLNWAKYWEVAAGRVASGWSPHAQTLQEARP